MASAEVARQHLPQDEHRHDGDEQGPRVRRYRQGAEQSECDARTDEQQSDLESVTQRATDRRTGRQQDGGERQRVDDEEDERGKRRGDEHAWGRRSDVAAQRMEGHERAADRAQDLSEVEQRLEPWAAANRLRHQHRDGESDDNRRRG